MGRCEFAVVAHKLARTSSPKRATRASIFATRIWRLPVRIALSVPINITLSICNWALPRLWRLVALRASIRWPMELRLRRRSPLSVAGRRRSRSSAGFGCVSDLIPGASIRAGGGSLDHWSNTAAFSTNFAPGQFYGTASRLSDPWTRHGPMSICRSPRPFSSADTKSFEVRATADNAFKNGPIRGREHAVRFDGGRSGHLRPNHAPVHFPREVPVLLGHDDISEAEPNRVSGICADAGAPCPAFGTWASALGRENGIDVRLLYLTTLDREPSPGPISATQRTTSIRFPA